MQKFATLLEEQLAYFTAEVAEPGEAGTACCGTRKGRGRKHNSGYAKETCNKEKPELSIQSSVYLKFRKESVHTALYSPTNVLSVRICSWCLGLLI